MLASFYTILIPCGLVVRIWRSHRHGPGSIPGMGIFLKRNFSTNGLHKPPKSLESTFHISVVDKLISPPHHYHDYYPVFLFEFDDCLVYGQRHNTSKVTYTAMTFFRKFFGTINPDSDALSLETDFTNVKERSKNVNLKLIEIKCEVLRITH